MQKSRCTERKSGPKGPAKDPGIWTWASSVCYMRVNTCNPGGNPARSVGFLCLFFMETDARRGYITCQSYLASKSCIHTPGRKGRVGGMKKPGGEERERVTVSESTDVTLTSSWFSDALTVICFGKFKYITSSQIWSSLLGSIYGGAWVRVHGT